MALDVVKGWNACQGGVIVRCQVSGDTQDDVGKVHCTCWHGDESGDDYECCWCGEFPPERVNRASCKYYGKPAERTVQAREGAYPACEKCAWVLENLGAAFFGKLAEEIAAAEDAREAAP